jgi:hypothetical protein
MADESRLPSTSNVLLTIVLILVIIAMSAMVYMFLKFSGKCLVDKSGEEAMSPSSSAAITQEIGELGVLKKSGFALRKLDTSGLEQAEERLMQVKAASKGKLGSGLNVIDEEMEGRAQAAAPGVFGKLEDRLIPVASPKGKPLELPKSPYGIATGPVDPTMGERPLTKTVTSATMILTGAAEVPVPKRSHCEMLSAGDYITNVDPQELDRCCEAYPDIMGC